MQIFKLAQFEGPLDLLLSLIEKRKMDITHLSLAEVTDQYLEYLSSEQEIPLENLAWFLAVASRLILIKSRALLPLLALDDEEEAAIEDLEWQLREYQKFKEASLALGTLFATAHPVYLRPFGVPAVLIFFLPPRDLTPALLARHFNDVLGDIPVFEVLEKQEMAEVVTLEEKIEHLRVSLKERMVNSFTQLVSETADRMEVIVSFLALLELVKQRAVRAEQRQAFGDIRLQHQVESLA